MYSKQFKMDSLSRKEKEYQLRRTEILNAAERLFATKGFHNTTMAEVAETSEFSIGTLYQFFKSKEELYYTLVIEKFDTLHSLIKEGLNQFSKSLEQIGALIQTHLTFFQNHRDFFKIFIQERNTLESQVNFKLGETIRQKYLSYIEFVTQIMKKGVKERDLKKLNPKELAFFLMGIMNSFVFQWILNPREELLTSKLPLIRELFLEGASKKRKIHTIK